MRGRTRQEKAWRALAVCLAIGAAGGAAADAVSVSPTRIVAPAGAQDATLTVKATGSRPATFQIRVFRWDERTSPDQLFETREVVASPPITEIGPNQELTVRLLRTSNRAAQGHECYRVLVDRLPDSSSGAPQVALRIRHSVPLCFSG